MDGRWRLEKWKNLQSAILRSEWKKADVKNGISLTNMSFKKTDYAALKVEGDLPVAPDIAYDYLQRALQPGGKLDQIFRKEKILQAIDNSVPHATVVYNRYSVPLPGAAPRDMCLMKMWVPQYLTGDGTCGLVIMSVKHPLLPRSKETVGVQMELSGFVLTPVNGPGPSLHTRATIVAQLDLQDSLQSMLEGTYKSGLLKVGLRTAFSHISEQIQKFCALLQFGEY